MSYFCYVIFFTFLVLFIFVRLLTRFVYMFFCSLCFFFAFFLIFVLFCCQVVDRNRALTLDLQRERAERQRLQGHLVAAERGAQGTSSEYLKDTVDALEVE